MQNGESIGVNESYDLGRLRGENVSLWIYGRGSYPSDILYEIWRTLKDEDALHLMFPGRFREPCAKPFDTRMDLQEFATLMKEGTENACLLLCYHRKDNAFAGYIVFDELMLGHSGNVSVFFKRRYWGAITREGVALAYDYAKNFLRLKRLWDFVCWHHAIRLAKQFGFVEVGLMPKHQLVNGKEYDTHILMLDFTKEHSNAS